MTMHRSLAAAATVVLIAACSQQGGAVYRMPLAEAQRILLATGLPPQVFGSEEPAWDVRADGADIVWTVRRDGAELFHYVAHLSEQGAGATRVKVELKGAQGGPAGDMEKRLNEKPEVKAMYLVAVRERVASALERREFDLSRVYPAMTAAAVANMGSIKASADAAAEASNRQDRETIEKAYREEAEGRR